MANQYTSELTEQRAIAVKLLQRGQCTVADLARHFGLSHQIVSHWAKGIDVRAARAAYVARKVELAQKAFAE